MVKKVSLVFFCLMLLLFLQFGERCFADTASQFEQAENFISSGNYNGAIQIYQSIIADNPGANDAAKAQLNIQRVEAASLVKAGDFAEAETAVNNLVSNFAGNSDLPTALYHIARKYFEARKLEEAKLLYQLITQQHPESILVDDAGLKKGWMNALQLIRAENYSSAFSQVESFSSEFSGHPELPKILYQIARKYREPRKHLDARRLYKRIIYDYTD